MSCLGTLWTRLIGGGAAERGVWSAFVVVAKPVWQCLRAVVARAVDLPERPFAFQCLLVALDLAVDSQNLP